MYLGESILKVFLCSFFLFAIAFVFIFALSLFLSLSRTQIFMYIIKLYSHFCLVTLGAINKFITLLINPDSVLDLTCSVLDLLEFTLVEITALESTSARMGSELLVDDKNKLRQEMDELLVYYGALYVQKKEKIDIWPPTSDLQVFFLVLSRSILLSLSPIYNHHFLFPLSFSFRFFPRLAASYTCALYIRGWD